MDTSDVMELERAVIVMMFCAPTGFNFAWARPNHQLADGHTVDGERKDLPLSQDGKEFFEKLMTLGAGQKDHFAKVAEAMKDAWPTEPHPDLLQVQRIFAMVRKMT